MVVTTSEDDQAQEEYEKAYYEQFSDEEDAGDNLDFSKPSQLFQL